MTQGRLQGKRVAVVGGCGHVGLPLGIKCALAGAHTKLIDLNEAAVATVNSGAFPFLEQGGDAQLSAALGRGLVATTDREACQDADVVVFVVGTPVDEHLNPALAGVLAVFDDYLPVVRPGALIIMRSTLFPGTMEHLNARAEQAGKQIRLAFCPERVAQGFALDETDALPQIVSAFDDESFEAAYKLFAALSPEIVRLEPREAELAKLMTNAWRYLEFAIANQFYMIAEDSELDFFKIFKALSYNYPRAGSFKTPGFAAGPCLFKDTMQLASFFRHQFSMGHSAMFVNEGLATHVVEKAAALLGGDLWGKTVGLLGMAFKANNDDTRESLSFRVKKGLEFEGATVIFHDPYVPGGVSLDDLKVRADVVALCAPHREYLSFSCEQPLIDIWGFFHDQPVEVLPGTAAAEG